MTADTRLQTTGEPMFDPDDPIRREASTPAHSRSLPL